MIPTINCGIHDFARPAAKLISKYFPFLPSNVGLIANLCAAPYVSSAGRN
ncbi:hypothetical protein ASZ90_019638 [hydrocarbon metagenome]|uniref:Uncharacterized protein n=1 Tax=hydrocarbon metagenome TaxID=938273 RepID=A0A0W8E2U8_9ZZZZ